MLTIITLALFQLIPAKLVSAVAPNPPMNAIAGTCVLADVPVDGTLVVAISFLRPVL